MANSDPRREIMQSSFLRGVRKIRSRREHPSYSSEIRIWLDLDMMLDLTSPGVRGDCPMTPADAHTSDPHCHSNAAADGDPAPTIDPMLGRTVDPAPTGHPAAPDDK